MPEWARKDPILRQAMQAGQEAARAGDGGLSVAAVGSIHYRAGVACHWAAQRWEAHGI